MNISFYQARLSDATISDNKDLEQVLLHFFFSLIKWEKTTYTHTHTHTRFQSGECTHATTYIQILPLKFNFHISAASINKNIPVRSKRNDSGNDVIKSDNIWIRTGKKRIITSADLARRRFSRDQHGRKHKQTNHDAGMGWSKSTKVLLLVKFYTDDNVIPSKIKNVQEKGHKWELIDWNGIISFLYTLR